MMSDVKDEEICALSHEGCQEVLARLRVMLSESTARLDARAEAYYFLCELPNCAPEEARKVVEALIGPSAAAYVESWKELIALTRRAAQVLDQLEKTAAVELELQGLERSEQDRSG
jgi:hypothetical protein